MSKYRKDVAVEKLTTCTLTNEKGTPQSSSSNLWALWVTWSRAESYPQAHRPGGSGPSAVAPVVLLLQTLPEAVGLTNKLDDVSPMSESVQQSQG